MADAPIAFPGRFEAQIRAQLGGESGAFFDAMRQQPVRGIRLRDAARFFPEKDCLSPVPWSADACVLRPDSALGAHPLHGAGAYYLQEPSAMVPAAALAPGPGDRVLDLCAAPGGKAVQLARMLPHGLLIANEVHRGRAAVLSGNVERMGIANCVVTACAPERLAARFAGMFDAVLVDAPCSGEGMFRKNPAAMRMWSPQHAAGCARRQQGILADAARLVRPGGRLAYSTCTFNREENQGVVGHFLAAHPDFSPMPFSLPGLPPAPDGMLTVWPHRVQGEGQFVALLARSGDARPAWPEAFSPGDSAFLAAASALMQMALAEPVRPNARFGNAAVVAPLPPELFNGIPVLRLGLHAAYPLGRDLRPDHALALAQPARQSLPVDEAQARAFQEGQPLPAPASLRGWASPTLCGFQLGWGKASQGTLKNHFPKALRAAALRPADGE